MKRLFGVKLFSAAMLVSAAALVFCVSSFAATVTIKSATTDKGVALTASSASAPAVGGRDLITIEATNSVAGADLTILVIGSSVTLSNITDSDIKYIDQVTSDETGTAKLTFRMPVDVESGTYKAYISGTDATSNSLRYFKIEAVEKYIVGDVNFDGEADITDATLILRDSVGLDIPSDVYMYAGDVNNDTVADITDATFILRNFVGLPNPEGVEIGVEKTKPISQ